MFNRSIKTAILSLCLMSFSGVGFTQGAPAAAPAAAENPEKLADIRKLIALTGGDELGKQMIEQMVESFKQSFPQTPADFWQEFLSPTNASQLTELNVPIYDKYLTHDEIKEIIRFYESPTGKKLIEALPQISQESYQSGEQWGYDMGMKVRDKLIKGGYLKEETQAPPEAGATMTPTETPQATPQASPQP